MKIVIIGQHDPNIFPNMYYLGRELADAGQEVVFLSTVEPRDIGCALHGIRFIKIPTVSGLTLKVPLIRSNYHTIAAVLLRERPDWIIAQHEYILPSTLYRLLLGRRSRVAACFVDFHGARRYVRAMKSFAGAIDVYVDVCGMRVEWQREVWPRMTAKAFVARNTTLRQPERPFEPHQGKPRVVLTASAPMMLEVTDQARFSRFAARLCAQGIALDWYVNADDAARAAARELCSHPLYTVRDPLPKPRLMEALRGYDVGLFWAPLADCDPARARDRSVFLSAASNKISEYIAAGLAVAHTGNPGLAYLPAEVCTAFDPTDPEAGADQLAAAISDRAAVERMRQASLLYHRDEMNFEAQTEPLIRHVLSAG